MYKYLLKHINIITITYCIAYFFILYAYVYVYIFLLDSPQGKELLRSIQHAPQTTLTSQVVSPIVVEDKVMDNIADTVTTQGFLALFHLPEYPAKVDTLTWNYCLFLFVFRSLIFPSSTHFNSHFTSPLT